MPFAVAVLTVVLWSEWSYAPTVPGVPRLRGARETLLSESIALALCLSAVAVSIPGMLWLRTHRVAIKSWLLAPFRSWMGLDNTRRPKP